MEDGIDKVNFITIAVHPAEEGFACLVLERDNPPLTKEYSIALTMAHGMVKLALDRPDLVFDEGVDAMENPSQNKLVNIQEVMLNKKRKLH